MKRNMYWLMILSLLCGQIFASTNWFVNTEVKQDFRYRWQDETKKDAVNADGDDYVRYRERLRYRLGLETKANDETMFGARLATGGWQSDDPLSTNDSMGEKDNFTKDQISLDQAYLKYTPAWVPADFGIFTAMFGKFDVKDGIYTVTDIMWDSDISLEGKNINYQHSGFQNVSLFANIGSYLKLENAGYDDDILNVQQLGAKYSFLNDYVFEAAWAGYRNAHGLNSRKPFDNQMAKFTWNTFLIPFNDRVVLLYDMYKNTEESKENKGTAYGIGFGSGKLAKLGDWEIKYLQRQLDKNVNWTLGDSDVYEGTNKAFNTKGQEIEFKFAVAENASLSFDSYRIDKMQNDDTDANDKGAQVINQFDLNVKF